MLKKGKKTKFPLKKGQEIQQNKAILNLSILIHPIALVFGCNATCGER
jgi:hypothetical protein